VATRAGPARSARPSRAAVEWWLLAAALLVLVLALAQATREPSGRAVSRLDALVYDAGLSLWARPPRDDVVIVAIDDDSLIQVGRWPWRREVTALLLERLQAAGPRSIGIDLLFAEPAAGDARLAAAADGPAPVVLPIARPAPAADGEPPLVPVAGIGRGRALAHVEFPIDGDGLIRGLYLREGGFPAMAARLAFPDPTAPDPGGALARLLRNGDWPREGWLRLGASSAQPERLSAAAVLRGEVPAERLRDRIVLVGATARGLGDVHATTLFPGNPTVPGVALHAAATSALLEGRTLAEAPHALRLAVSALALATALAVLYLTQPRTGLACVAAAMAATVGAVLAAIGAGVWFAPGALLVGLALAFPLWSWRRLHAASIGLIAQAARLEADAAPGDPDPSAPVEPISRQLRRLEHAADRITDLNRRLADTLATLQAAQREREQTLRFLSHDLRAPHLSILDVLERADGGPVPADDARAIARQSRRALELTDGFMQLARAESQPLRAEPRDLADLAIEAADGCWARASARGLSIATPDPPDGDAPIAACRCDATLVRRALVNLLDNALRVAPSGDTVGIELAREGAGWWIAVLDRGPGVPEADRARIFEPWWRGPKADPSSGAGLGLAFVATVAQRHGGRAEARPRDGGGARIGIWLPDAAASGRPEVDSGV
jgi:CHASE2 domain-containing sensor protein